MGHIDGEFITRHLPDLSTPLFYVSGPKTIVKATAKLMADLGVARERIKRDSFPDYD